ncbi:MAG: helix-turn-helix domain-containing protein [Pseudomonadota bacterium]
MQLLHLLDMPADENVVEHVQSRDPLFTERLVTTTELADFLKISPQAVANHRSRESGPPWVDIGGQVRYRIADVVLWLREHRKYRNAA